MTFNSVIIMDFVAVCVIDISGYSINMRYYIKHKFDNITYVMVRSVRNIFFRAEIISEANDFRNSTRNC